MTETFQETSEKERRCSLATFFTQEKTTMRKKAW